MRRLLVLAMAVGVAATALPGGAQGASAGPRCHAADLAGAIIDIQGAAGTLDGRLVLVNKSSRRCHLRGFVGGRLLNRRGQPLPTTVTRDPSTPARTVVMPPGAAAAAHIRWNDVGPTPCRTPPVLRVTPPGAVKTIRVHFGRLECGGRLRVFRVTDPTTVG